MRIPFWFFLFYFFLVVGSKGQELFEQRDDGFVRALDDSYLRGLNFLQSRQEDAGGWRDSSYGSEPGVMGMAILAFLSRGDDPEFGPYSGAISRSVDAIIKKQNEETGYIGSSMYNHGFATLALAEFYGMTNDRRIGPALRKATQLILASQKRNPKGGWRYSPESKDADTTVSGAQMVALFAARNAGIQVPDEAFEKGKAFLLSCQDNNGGFGYQTNSEPTFHELQSVLWFCPLPVKPRAKPTKNPSTICVKTPNSETGATSSTACTTPPRRCSAFPPGIGTPGTLRTFGVCKTLSWKTAPGMGITGASLPPPPLLLSMALNYRYLPIYER